MTYLKAIPWSLLAVLAITGGCGTGHVNIGAEQDAQVKSGIDAFVGNWDGYVEAYTFLDGSDQIRITISSDGTAKIRFGKQDLRPLPTDPNADFLPTYSGYDYTTTTTARVVENRPVTGFNYALNDVQIDAERVRASAWTNEVFERPCAMQTPHVNHGPFSSPEYLCGPDCQYVARGSDVDAGLPATDCYTFSNCPASDVTNIDWQAVDTRVSCDQAVVCNGGNICLCDANACSLVANRRIIDMHLDAALEDNQHSLVGTLVLPSESNTPTNLTIRLKRQ